MNKALSYSSLSKYAECPLRFIAEKSATNLVHGYTEKSARGTIVHKFLEELCNDYIANGKWMDMADAIELMKDMWTNGFITKDTGDNILYEVDWNLEFLEKSIADSLLLVPQIYNDVLPFIDPVSTESLISIPLQYPGSEYTHLHGVVDLVNKTNSIIDWKTSTSVRSQDMLEYDLQATIYAALSGFEKCDVHFVQFIYLKRDDPRIVWQTTKRDKRHTDWLMSKYLPRVVEHIESGIMPPTPGWHCAGCPVQCGVNPNVEVYSG